MSLLKEMRFIPMLRRGDAGIHGECARWASMRMHRITSDIMVKLGHTSKMIAE
jgi:NTE family protein